MSTVNVTVLDQTDTPVVSALVILTLKTNPLVFSTALTNGSGVATLSAADGAYWLMGVLHDYIFVEKSTTVSGTTNTTAAMQSVGGATCLVSGAARDASGEPLIGLEIAFYAGSHSGQGIGSLVMGAPKVSVTTDNDGLFTVPLEKLAVLRVRCPQLRLDDLVITVPPTDTALLATLIEEALA